MNLFPSVILVSKEKSEKNLFGIIDGFLEVPKFKVFNIVALNHEDFKQERKNFKNKTLSLEDP